MSTLDAGISLRTLDALDEECGTMTTGRGTGQGRSGPAPTMYRITVRGVLGPDWADWFDGLTVRAETSGETTLTGAVVDQAALHGLLAKVRDLGLPLLAVARVPTDGPTDDKGGR